MTPAPDLEARLRWLAGSLRRGRAVTGNESAELEAIADELARRAERIAALEEALTPLVELFDWKVNMNDPISKWLIMGQLQSAADALTKDKPVDA